MALKLMYITNNDKIARIAENSGVDWIFIDLEINGKQERQGHLDTVISRHHVDDVKRIKKLLTKAELLARINPIYHNSEEEINTVILNGADIIMLPFFKSKCEVERFINYVNGRAKTCLLCETPEAVENIDDILSVEGIDFIHIGLNDLHLGYHMKFMFELLAEGTVEMLCNKFKARGITYGFGGIAKLGQGMLPAEHIMAEHYRLGSTMAILSRSFCNTSKMECLDEVKGAFNEGINEIRKFENELVIKDENFYIQTQSKIKELVIKIKDTLL